VAASSKQQQHAVGLPREKYCRISLPQNQPTMSSTPPVLVVCSHNQFMTQNSHNSRTSNSCGNPVNKALTGAEIGNMQGVTRILLNLPREYQRWNKYYGNEGKLIQPKKKPTKTASGMKNNSKKKKQKPDMLKQPFNVTCKINESFKYCTHRRLKKAD
jgi:hypothetical protein